MFSFEYSHSRVSVNPKKISELKTLHFLSDKYYGTSSLVEDVVNKIRRERRNAKAAEHTWTIKRRVTAKRIAQATYSSSKSYLTHLDRLALIRELRQTVQRIRRDERQPKFEAKSILGYVAQTQGGVFVNEGSFLQAFLRLQNISAFDTKRPHTNDKYIGIEIEAYSPHDHDSLARLFTQAGLNRVVTIGDDGSIAVDKPNHTRFELRVLAKQRDYARTVKRVCDVLHIAKARVNKTCGMHVHLDMRQRDPKIAFHNLTRAQELLFALQPNSRRANNYCRKTSLDWDTAIADRYRAVNARAYAEHKTIEVRLHTGTVNARKIVNWISLLLRIVDAPALPHQVHQIGGLARVGITLPARLKTYLEARVEKFGNAYTEEDEHVAA